MIKVAEISCNHMNSLDTVKRIIELAKLRGFTHAKIQVYSANRLWNKEVAPKEWVRAKEYELDPPQVAHIFKHFSKILPIFPSVYSKEDIDFCENFNPIAYKIAAPEIWDTSLLEYAAKKGRPLILSMGWALGSDMLNLVKTHIDPYSSNTLTICHTTPYMTPPSLFAIEELEILASELNCQYGLSDHSPAGSRFRCYYPICYIERHVCIHSEAPDAIFSTNLTKEDYFGPAYIYNYHHRVSYYATRDISQGETIAPSDVISLRPFNKNSCLDPIGSTAAHPIPKRGPILNSLLVQK